MGVDQYELSLERQGRKENVTVNGGTVIEEVFG